MYHLASTVPINSCPDHSLYAFLLLFVEWQLMVPAQGVC